MREVINSFIFIKHKNNCHVNIHSFIFRQDGRELSPMIGI